MRTPRLLDTDGVKRGPCLFGIGKSVASETAMSDSENRVIKARRCMPGTFAYTGKEENMKRSKNKLTVAKASDVCRAFCEEIKKWIKL